MFRVGLVLSDGKILSQNFETRELADDWILEKASSIGVKKAIIVNLANNSRDIINFEV